MHIQFTNETQQSIVHRKLNADFQLLSEMKYLVSERFKLSPLIYNSRAHGLFGLRARSSNG